MAVGSFPLTISFDVHHRATPTGARWLPKIVTHDPGAMPPLKLAPFTTEVITGAAAARASVTVDV